MALPHFNTKNMKKVSKYLEINEEPIYTQLKNNNSSFIFQNDFILDYFDKCVNDGKLSKITKDNLPYFYSYKQRDLERKVKIQKIINSFDIKFLNYTNVSIDGTEYNSVMFETGVIKTCGINNEPQLLDSDLKKILTFCKENGITHIYEIIEKRFGVEINKVNLSINNIFNIHDFEDYGLSYRDITHSAYNTSSLEEGSEDCCDSEESEVGYNYNNKYYDVDINKLKHSENSIKDCYVFNEVSYTVKGIKTFSKEVLDDFTMCKVDFEYFYNKYIKNK